MQQVLTLSFASVCDETGSPGTQQVAFRTVWSEVGKQTWSALCFTSTVAPSNSTLTVCSTTSQMGGLAMEGESIKGVVTISFKNELINVSKTGRMWPGWTNSYKTCVLNIGPKGYPLGQVAEQSSTTSRSA